VFFVNFVDHLEPRTVSALMSNAAVQIVVGLLPQRQLEPSASAEPHIQTGEANSTHCLHNIMCFDE